MELLVVLDDLVDVAHDPDPLLGHEGESNQNVKVLLAGGEENILIICPRTFSGSSFGTPR